MPASLSSSSAALRLPAAQFVADERSVRSAFLAMPRALPNGRPSPRWRWDNVGRLHNWARPWSPLFEASDAVAADAIASRCARVIRASAADVRAFFDAAAARAMAPFAPGLVATAPPLAECVGAVLRETSEAVARALEALSDGETDDRDLEEIDRELAEAEASIQEARRSVAERLRERRRQGRGGA